jgi:flavin-dependent dehydrogenase
LLDAAREARATIETGVSVSGTVTDAEGRVNGIAVRDRAGSIRRVDARVVVGADGVRSRIARSVGARVVQRRPDSGSLQYIYAAGLDAAGFEFHIGERSLAGVFPTHHGEANVWICTPRAGHTSFLDLLRECAPALAVRVQSARVVSPTRKAAGLPNHLLQVAGRGWALVGDAGYHRDPITGHGITDAFRDAELLARALVLMFRDGVPEDVAMASYEHERNRALAAIFDVTCCLSRFPAVDDFIELQKRLSVLIDEEAAWLATLPPFQALSSAAA